MAVKTKRAKRIIDEVAVRRFYNREDAGVATSIEALNAALEEVENNKEITSVYIICLDNEGRFSTFSAGPKLAKLRNVWLMLQEECLRVIELMINDD